MAMFDFTLEIRETWVKKIIVRAESRGEAKAKALAEYIDEFKTSSEGIAFKENTIRDVTVELEWPDGNPKRAEEK